jgi:hypothetical protein
VFDFLKLHEISVKSLGPVGATLKSMYNSQQLVQKVENFQRLQREKKINDDTPNNILISLS